MNNPYASAEPAIEGHFQSYPARFGDDGAKIFPAAITVIGVIFLIFGIVGVPTGIWTLVSPYVFQYLPQTDDKAQKIMIDQMSEMWPFLTFSGVYCTIMSLAMFIAAVGLLRKRLWGAKLAVIVCFAAIVYKLIELGGAVYSQQSVIDQMTATMSRTNSNETEVATISRIMSFGIIGVAILFSIPFYIFYGWAAYYLKKPETRSHLR